MTFRIERIIIALVFAAVMRMPAIASDDTGGTPLASFGAGATFGSYDVIATGSDQLIWKGGTGYGGGLMFEYMWNQVFGIHSGFWYAVSTIELKFNENDPVTIDARTEHFWMPLYLITSYRSGMFGIGLLTGMNFMYVHKCEFLVDSPMGSDEMDVTEYMRYDLYGIAGGLELKIGVTRFIDICIGGMAEIYARGFIKSTSRTQDYLYDFRFFTGVLFRTY